MAKPIVHTNWFRLIQPVHRLPGALKDAQFVDVRDDSTVCRDEKVNATRSTKKRQKRRAKEAQQEIKEATKKSQKRRESQRG